MRRKEAHGVSGRDEGVEGWLLGRRQRNRSKVKYLSIKDLYLSDIICS